MTVLGCWLLATIVLFLVGFVCDRVGLYLDLGEGLLILMKDMFFSLGFLSLGVSIGYALVHFFPFLFGV